jgi:hypothetical protein
MDVSEFALTVCKLACVLKGLQGHRGSFLQFLTVATCLGLYTELLDYRLRRRHRLVRTPKFLPSPRPLAQKLTGRQATGFVNQGVAIISPMTPPSVSTQRVYSVGLVVVSARTNKKYHHHLAEIWAHRLTVH